MQAGEIMTQCRLLEIARANAGSASSASMRITFSEIEFTPLGALPWQTEEDLPELPTMAPTSISRRRVGNAAENSTSITRVINGTEVNVTTYQDKALFTKVKKQSLLQIFFWNGVLFASVCFVHAILWLAFSRFEGTIEEKIVQARARTEAERTKMKAQRARGEWEAGGVEAPPEQCCRELSDTNNAVEFLQVHPNLVRSEPKLVRTIHSRTCLQM